jgi:cell division transport system permease protein
MITAMLCGVLALGGTSAALLQNLYSQWNLHHTESLTIYLPPETDPAAVSAFTDTLPTIAGVGQAAVIPPAALESQLADLTVSATNLPLPTVLTVPFDSPEASDMLTAHVQKAFPAAEIDDHKALLGQVRHTVRNLQGVALGLGGLMLVLVGLLVTLTTRTGLVAESATLRLLVQMGTTDNALIKSLSLQVGQRVMVGYLIGAGAASIVFAVGLVASPTLAAYSNGLTVAAMLGLPLLLPVVAILTAAFTTRNLLKNQTL